MMKYLTQVLALTRLLLLKRQWREVLKQLNLLDDNAKRLLAALVYGETQRAAKHPLPQFYGSDKVDLYRPWGDAVEHAFARLHSDNPQLRLRGIATWLTVVFHETQQAGQPGLKTLHGEVARYVEQYRTLHERVLAIRAAA
ncbi:MAG TPA: hypothetical protein VEA16_11575 [Vicinamibacterales bacterium]|nr:hypothetical protein [Vicinamibacterales bacterium]